MELKADIHDASARCRCHRRADVLQLLGAIVLDNADLVQVGVTSEEDLVGGIS